MHRFSELIQSLIKVWNEIYLDGRSNKDLINLILEEHRMDSVNEITNTAKYPFVQNTLIEIDALDVAKDSFKELIASINKASEIITWYPNTTFSNPEEAIKRENYCANLIGKPRDMQKSPYLFSSDKIICGLFLMGKHQLYPEHYHPAQETWVILSGNAEWKSGDGDWQIKQPSDWFTYTENQVHAMKTGDEPLLALWVWTGDFSSWAKWK